MYDMSFGDHISTLIYTLGEAITDRQYAQENRRKSNGWVDELKDSVICVFT